MSSCPEEPPAPAKPRKRLRRDSSTLRATTARMTGKPVPLRAKPMSSPAPTLSSRAVDANAMSTRPSTYIRPQTAITRPEP